MCHKMIGFAMALLVAVVVVAGCGRMRAGSTSLPDGFSITMDAQPSRPVVGDGQLIVTLADPAGRPIADARLEVEGNMSHAGMKPSFGTVTAAAAGRYTVAIRWTMAGDWYVDIKATLADGRVIVRRFPLTVYAQ
ncbi:MAG: FixH family protein [Anaerolineae bacterium]|nr:FixH family protein [Anaerolineae bacterium]